MQVGATTAATNTETSAPVQQKKELGKEAFLQLLVAQVKNQNPMNPTDGVQFLSQLAQFSQLEQLLGIREDLGAIKTSNENIASGDNK